MTSLARPLWDRRWTAAQAAFAAMLVAAFVAALALLGGGPSLAAPPWTSLVQEGRFVFRADFPLEQAADALACASRTAEEAPRLLGLAPRRRPAAFYLFADEPAMRSYLAKRLPDVPLRRSLFVQGSGHPMVFAQRSAALATDLRHESTHVALHALWAEVPLWLDEGLAEYCEAAPPARLRGHPWLAQATADARLGRAVRLDALEAKTRAETLRDADYRAAWAWVHFLLNGPAEARDELRRYCAAWDAYDARRRGDGPNAVGAAASKAAEAAGDPAERPDVVAPEPLSKRLARRMPDLERQFLRHFAGD